MPIYKVIIKKNALRFINKQDKATRARLYSAIYKLPYGDVKKLKVVYNRFYSV